MLIHKTVRQDILKTNIMGKQPTRPSRPTAPTRPSQPQPNSSPNRDGNKGITRPPSRPNPPKK